MVEHITIIDLKILGMYVKDYLAEFSIRQITTELKINYSNAFNRIKKMIQQNLLLEQKKGPMNSISLNINNIDTIQLISFIEEQNSKELKNTTLRLIIQELIKLDPFACMGLFGSRASGMAGKDSDWDIFIITQESKEVSKIMSHFPHIKNIDLQIFSFNEFKESLLTQEDNVVKHIIRNKQLIYNPHPFYGIIYNLEMIKHAPTQ